MNTGGMFPKWVEPFDTWHLRLLPPILLGLALTLVLLPSHQNRSPSNEFSNVSIPSTQTSPTRPQTSIGVETSIQPTQRASAPNSNALVPQAFAIAAMRPTRIESPSQNALFWRDRLGDVEGTAEPGSLIRLFHGDRLLSQSTASPDGRFRFRLLDFPAGSHTVRVIATLDRRAQASETVSFLVKSEMIPKPVTKTSQQTPQTAQASHSKNPTPLKNTKPSTKKDRQSGHNP